MTSLVHSASMEEILQQPQTTDSSIFSHFPVEVVRLIFEFSAMHNNQTAASLARVSKLVHRWVVPILYETITIEQPRGLLNIISTVSSDGVSQHLVPFVRNVCINLLGRSDTLICSLPFPGRVDIIIRVCKNIQNIYINDAHLPLRYPMGCRHPHLKHLHCGSWDSWLNHDILSFHSLTHLRVDLAYNSGVSSSWRPLLPPLMRLPNLTHLAIGADKRSPESELRLAGLFLHRILTRPRMAMLVLTLWFCQSESKPLSKLFAAASDPRFCILMMPNSPHDESSVKEWQDEVRGGKSIWDKAAALMKRHREDGRQGLATGLL